MTVIGVNKKNCVEVAEADEQRQLQALPTLFNLS